MRGGVAGPSGAEELEVDPSTPRSSPRASIMLTSRARTSPRPFQQNTYRANTSTTPLRSSWLLRISRTSHHQRSPTCHSMHIAFPASSLLILMDEFHLTRSSQHFPFDPRPLHQRAVLVPLFQERPEHAHPYKPLFGERGRGMAYSSAHGPRKTKLRPSKGVLEARRDPFLRRAGGLRNCNAMSACSFHPNVHLVHEHDLPHARPAQAC